MSVTRTKRDLKQEVAEAFIDMVIEDGLDKVRVLDIVKSASINKNSFYYHFTSKYDVAHWIFRSDIAAMLSETFPSEHLVFPEGIKDESNRNSYPELPFYVRVPLGARVFDQGAFFKETVLCLRRRQDYYQRMLGDSNPDGLVSYMGWLYEPAFEKDVEIIADGRFIPPTTRRFLGSSILKLFLGLVDDLVCMRELPEDLLDDARNPFWNFASESINEAIRNHPIRSTNFPMKSYWT